MKTKNFIIGTLVGALAYFLGWIGYGMLFTNLYPESVQYGHTMLFYILGALFFGALLTYIFMKWAGISAAMTGAYAGAIIGFLNTASMNFYMYSGREANYGNIFTDIILNIVIVGLTGACIGFVLGKMK